jgi:uncharacterized membrane protein YkvA (DUF1232 family)
MTTLWHAAAAIAAGLAVCWLALLVLLWLSRPSENLLREGVRIIPDVIRLTRRLAVDRSLPRRLRLWLWLLLAYLASPIDLVPDFIPVIGYADDAAAVAIVLRRVLRAAGRDTLARHWPGTPQGLAVVERLAGSP